MDQGTELNEEDIQTKCTMAGNGGRDELVKRGKYNNNLCFFSSSSLVPGRVLNTKSSEKFEIIIMGREEFKMDSSPRQVFVQVMIIRDAKWKFKKELWERKRGRRELMLLSLHRKVIMLMTSIVSWSWTFSLLFFLFPSFSLVTQSLP